MSKIKNTEQGTESIGDLARLACVVEVVSHKAGNVHPGAAFHDTTWIDFVASAIVTAPLLDCAGERGVGPTVLACVRATREVIGSNTNLGMILLLAPLCAVPSDVTLCNGIVEVLEMLSQDDAEAVYEAIRLANPGGLGARDDNDIRQPASIGLVQAMELAAELDTVARQYTNHFADVIGRIGPRLSQKDLPVDRAMVRGHLEQMALEPDSLIRRKCGLSIAQESQARAAAVLAAGWPDSPQGMERFRDLDHWLRADGHRRNPGTSADLLAAGFFVALRERWIEHPFEWSLQTILVG